MLKFRLLGLAAAFAAFAALAAMDSAAVARMPCEFTGPEGSFTCSHRTTEQIFAAVAISTLPWETIYVTGTGSVLQSAPAKLAAMRTAATVSGQKCDFDPRGPVLWGVCPQLGESQPYDNYNVQQRFTPSALPLLEGE